MADERPDPSRETVRPPVPRPGSGEAAGELPVPEPLPGSDPQAGRRHVTCRVCGHPLRDRLSRLWGLGPDCRAKFALRTAPSPPAHEVEQETLPGM